MLIEFPKVKNAYGEEFDFCAAVNIMDHDLCMECSNTSYKNETPQQFFDRYCAAHYKKFAEEFELAKENPENVKVLEDYARRIQYESKINNTV